MQVTEGTIGYWHYHLSPDGKHWEALCGAKTMQTSIKVKDFGIPFGEHFPKRPTWCAECKRIAAIAGEKK